MLKYTYSVCLSIRYTYGEPVRGLLDFSACLDYYSYKRRSSVRDRCYNLVQEDVSTEH